MTTSTTAARRTTYAAVLAQLQTDPPAEFIAHCELMAKIGYTREKLTHTWANRRAALMHPFDDPDWEIVPLGEVCTAADITYARARELGAFDALSVPGVAINMTTRDAIAQWCETHSGHHAEADHPRLRPPARRAGRGTCANAGRRHTLRTVHV